MIPIYVITIIPLVIWGLMEPIAGRFPDFVTSMTSVGQMLGLLGMMLFSINLILAGRLKIFDKYFKGLDKMYQHHAKIGVIGFAMMLFHPLFLVVKYLAISTNEAALFFVPFVKMPVTWGIISLLILILLIVFTFYIKMKYHKWKMSHKFMTLAFFFSILHILFINSDISRNHILSTYIFFFALVGLVLSIRQVFFSRFIKKFEYKVVGNRLLNKDVREITMSPISKKLDYKSGQFIFIKFINSGIKKEMHPFTISSSPLENNLKLTIKNFGDFTNSLSELRVGDKALLEGPYGSFHFKDKSSKNQIWIAGGIGITPFVSMVREVGKDNNIDFYCCVKDKTELVYLDELQEFAKNNPNFKLNLWCSSDSGYINASSICGGVSDVKNREILICGPIMFMESLKNQFVESGVDKSKIHYENFSF